MTPFLRRWSKRVFRALLAAITMSLLGWHVLPWAIPLPHNLLQPQPPSPTFIAADGTPLRQLLSEDGQRIGQPVPFLQLPSTLIHATLAAEDKRFFRHGGVDLLAISRSAWDNVTQGRVVSGASTLTQQLLKISADRRKPRTLLTKLTESLQARRLEMTWPKERILTEYLHRVSYGNLLTGCQSASLGYFNKPLPDLTPAECAFLAALPQAPTRLNPFKNLPALQKRQKHVLARMSAAGWLESEPLELAFAEKLTLQRFTGGFAAPHAVDLLSQQLPATPEIRTTIEPGIQNRVETILQHRLSLLEGKHVTQAAAVVIENATGKVLVLAGSRDFFGSDSGQINGAWAPHSPGSALKPFTYLLALQSGFTAASIIPDLPVEYQTPTGLYRPENYDRRLNGPVPLRTALASSLNIPAVRVLQQIGGEAVLHRTLQELGITTLDQPPEHYGLGLTIGNAPVRLLELANAYACIARQGIKRPWTLLQTPPADTAPAESQSEPQFQRQASFLIADILSDNQARVLTFGPHSVIRMPFPCAVKTGTSTNYRDNWTLGFTPEFTVGVWVGNFDNTPMNQVSGVTGAGPVFRDIFTHLHDTRGTTWYTAPAELVRARIDPRNGRVLTPQSPLVSLSRGELFLPGTVPPPALAADYEPGTGKACLPPEYASWLTRTDHWLSDLVCLRPVDPTLAIPRITTPLDGTIFYLDPDLRDQGQKLMLQASLPGLEWSSPSLEITTDREQPFAKLTVGHHELTARQPGSDDLARVSIEVRPPPTAADRRSRLLPPQPGAPVRQQPQSEEQRP
ncbi:MAG TPA: penicillin-binding protein 1C [Verrucomicrobium sp.]|nr:penicillin-binding protein 1C [Verrucomicrobium sp.]